MLPYFKYTEDVQIFCQLTGFTIDLPEYPTKYVCTYMLEDFSTRLITPYNLDPKINLLIPPEKVIEYLTLMLNGYSYENALKEIGLLVVPPLSIT